MSDRFVCTAENPWSKEKAERSAHPDAVEIDNHLYDCCAKYKCPHCGLTFKEELPPMTAKSELPDERPQCCSLTIATQDDPIFEGKELVCGMCGRTWFYHNVGGWKQQSPELPERIWLQPMRTKDGYFITGATDDIGVVEYVRANTHTPTGQDNARKAAEEIVAAFECARVNVDGLGEFSISDRIAAVQNVNQIISKHCVPADGAVPTRADSPAVVEGEALTWTKGFPQGTGFYFARLDQADEHPIVLQVIGGKYWSKMGPLNETPLHEYFEGGEPEFIGPITAAPTPVPAASVDAEAMRRETWKAAIKVAQKSVTKSVAASLDVAAAEMLIRRLESAALESLEIGATPCCGWNVKREYFAFGSDGEALKCPDCGKVWFNSEIGGAAEEEN